MGQKRLSAAAKRRLRAGRMRRAGNGPAAVAAAVGVAWHTVYTWPALLEEGGQPRLIQRNLHRFAQPCGNTPRSMGLAPNCGRSGTWARSASASPACTFARRRCGAFWAAWGSVRKSPGNARSSATKTRCLRLKKAPQDGRRIVFVDESRISERPTRVHTWGLTGHTPNIQLHVNGNHVSISAGHTRTNCLFRLHEGRIKQEEIVAFLHALTAHLPQPLLILWDGLKAHRRHLVRDYLDDLAGHIQITSLPPSAPDRTPVEYLWAWLTRQALANACPNDLAQLHVTARNTLKHAQKRPSILAACWKQTTVW